MRTRGPVVGVALAAAVTLFVSGAVAAHTRTQAVPRTLQTRGYTLLYALESTGTGPPVRVYAREASARKARALGAAIGTVTNLSASPDGRSAVLTTRAETSLGQTDPGGVYLVDVAGGTTHKLRPASATFHACNTEVRWTSTSRGFFCSDTSGVWRVDRATGAFTDVRTACTAAARRLHASESFASRVVGLWDAVGRKVVVSCGAGEIFAGEAPLPGVLLNEDLQDIGTGVSAKPGSCTVTVDSAPSVRLKMRTGIKEQTLDFLCAWSNRGTKLAFVSGGRLMVNSSASTSGATIVSNNVNLDFFWSPTDRDLLVDRNVMASLRGDAALVNRLRGVAFGADIAWWHDASHLLVCRSPARLARCYVIGLKRSGKKVTAKWTQVPRPVAAFFSGKHDLGASFATFVSSDGELVHVWPRGKHGSALYRWNLSCWANGLPFAQAPSVPLAAVEWLRVPRGARARCG